MSDENKSVETKPVSPLITNLDQLAILNFLENQRFLVCNWKKGSRKWIWVNVGQVKDTGLSKEYWYKMDMNNGQSAAMEEFQEEVYQKVQCLGETFVKTKTVHAGGVPRNLIQTFKPLRMKLEDWEEEKTMALLEVKDADSKGDADVNTEQNKMAMAMELLQHSETITMMFDAETGQLEYGNQKMAKLYEQTDDSQTKRSTMNTLKELFAHMQVQDQSRPRDKLYEDVTALKLGSDPIEIDCRLVFPNQPSSNFDVDAVWHQFHFISALSPVTSKPAVIVTQSDITKLQQQSQQLMDANRQQEAFTSAVSHELRTPLNGIIGLSESLIQNPECTEKMLKTLKLVKSSGMRLAGLVNDILDAASARRGRFVIKRELVLLKEVSDNCCEMLTSICPRNVKLINKVDDEKCMSHIEGDSSRINQILTNLLSNSIKFTEKGTITLQSRMISRDEVLIEVVDSGCGIPEDKWEQVWSPFKQVDMSTTRKYGGTGLGLSLVKELVEAHNGRVGLSSRTDGPDKGSTFFFILPMRQPRSDGDSSITAESAVLRAEDILPGVLFRNAPPPPSLDSVKPPKETEAETESPETPSSFKRKLPQPVASSELAAGGMSAQAQATQQVEQCKHVRRAQQRSRTNSRSSSPERVQPDEGLGAVLSLRRASQEIERMKDDAKNSMKLGTDALGSENQPRSPQQLDSTRLKHYSEIHGTFEILSVDDHVVNHIVVENSLTPKGYTVTTCMSGPEALELLDSRGYLPDLILLDCMMPHMSGYEMCEKLREQYPCNTLPVIMVSAKTQEDDIVKGLQAGCNDYISKPYGSQELNARIDVQFKLRYLWHMEVSRALSTRDAVLHPPSSPARSRRSSLQTGELNHHNDCTVLLCDIWDMLFYVRALPAEDLAVLVNELYDRFDRVATFHHLTRVIDDSYMLVLEDDSLNAQAQASKMLAVAQELLSEANQVRILVQGVEETPKVRVGMARGTAYSALVGMKLTSHSYFGQAVRDAVSVAVKSPAGCVVMSEGLMMELGDARRVTQYARQRKGEMMYIARCGQYEEALRELAKVEEGEGPVDVESDLGMDALNPLSHLRAFLRLSTDMDKMERTTSGRSSSGTECHRCQEFQLKVEALEKQIQSNVAAMSSPTGRGGGLASLPRRGSGGSTESGTAWNTPLHTGSDSGSIPFPRSSSVASHMKLAQVPASGCVECQDLRDQLEESQYELRRLKMDLRKRTEESYQAEMTRDAATGSQSPHRQSSMQLSSEPQEVEILSVDDDPVNQMVVENLLEPLGYTVTACMNGIEALEYLRTCSRLPNLVLLDVMMPQMNGYECCQQIRQTYNRMALPVIMVSAKSQVESVVEGLEAGCNDYVSKPFNRVELLARISTQLRVRDASRAEVEIAKANKLLTRLLPEHIIIQLRQNQTMIFEEHRNTTVLCCRIIGFGELVASLPSMELFSMFNRMVDTFVELGERHGCSLASIAGDMVVMVIGHDGRAEDNHAGGAVRMSMDMLRAVKDITFPSNPEKHLQIRLGVHSGISYAGVIGARVPRYEFLGDTVMIAKAMEEEGYAMNIRLTKDTAVLLGEGWDLEAVGQCRVPGQGMVQSFLVKDRVTEWQAALELMAMSDATHGGDIHNASASFTRRIAMGGHGNERLDPVREADLERTPSMTSPRSNNNPPSFTMPNVGPGLTKEDVAEVLKGILGQVPASQQHMPSADDIQRIASLSAFQNAAMPTREQGVGVGGEGGEGKLHPLGCAKCAEKELIIQTKADQLSEAHDSIESLKAENGKLINACSGLADHSRMVAAGHAQDHPPMRNPPPRPPPSQYTYYEDPRYADPAMAQQGPMGYMGGLGPSPGPATGRVMPPPPATMAGAEVPGNNRAEKMLAGLYMSAQDKVLNTLLQSCINADAGPRASMPHNPYDPMATPQQSWGPNPLQRDPMPHPDYYRSHMQHPGSAWGSSPSAPPHQPPMQRSADPWRGQPRPTYNGGRGGYPADPRGYQHDAGAAAYYAQGSVGQGTPTRPSGVASPGMPQPTTVLPSPEEMQD